MAHRGELELKRIYGERRRRWGEVLSKEVSDIKYVDINSSCTQKNERKSFEGNCGSYLARQALRVEITAYAFG